MMTEKQKYFAIGGIMLALLGFLGYKAFAKPKVTPPPPKKRKGSVIVDEPSTGGFLLPAEVTTRSGTRLRSSSSTSSSVVYTYPAGTKLLVKGDATQSDGQWFQVFDAQGRTGWVRSDVVDYKITTSETPSSNDSEQEYWDYLEQIHG
jgi:hypothetical protein